MAGPSPNILSRLSVLKLLFALYVVVMFTVAVLSLPTLLVFRGALLAFEALFVNLALEALTLRLLMRGVTPVD